MSRDSAQRKNCSLFSASATTSRNAALASITTMTRGVLEYGRGRRFESASLVRFGPFELDLESRELKREANCVRLQTQPLADASRGPVEIARSLTREFNTCRRNFEATGTVL